MKYFIVGLIQIYKLIPFSSHKNCRFCPTCSDYMIESIKKFGTIKGVKLGIKRIIKCNPLNKNFGYDPVPKE